MVGISIAYRKFGADAQEPVYKGFSKFAYHKFYVDELYNNILIKPYRFIGSAISRVIEPFVTDGPVRVVPWLYRMLGLAFRIVQVGYVRIYAIYMVIGLSIMSLLLTRSLNL